MCERLAESAKRSCIVTIVDRVAILFLAAGGSSLSLLQQSHLREVMGLPLLVNQCELTRSLQISFSIYASGILT